MEHFCQDQAFQVAISMEQRQNLCKNNTVWQNTIYSIINHDIDLKILETLNGLWHTFS